MSVISALDILLRANTAEFDKSMKAVHKKVDAFKHTLETGGGFIGAGLRKVFDLAFSSESFKQAFEGVDQLAKVSERLDIAPEKLAGLSLAAKMADVSFGDLATSTQKMMAAIAGSGNILEQKTAEKAFEQLGVGVEQLKGLAPEKQLATIADALKNVGDAGERVAVAKGIFGKGGIAMLNVLHDGAEGLEKWQKAAEDAGLAMEKMDVSKFTQANDSLKLMHEKLKGITLTISKELMPYVTAMATTVSDAVSSLLPYFKQWGTLLRYIIELTILYKTVVWAVVAAERALAVIEGVRAALAEKTLAQKAAALTGLAAIAAVAMYSMEKLFSKFQENVEKAFENLPKLGKLEDLQAMGAKDPLAIALRTNPQLQLGGSTEAYSSIVRGGATAPLAKLEKHAKRTADNTDKLTRMKGQPVLPARQGGLR